MNIDLWGRLLTKDVQTLDNCGTADLRMTPNLINNSGPLQALTPEQSLAFHHPICPAR